MENMIGKIEKISIYSKFLAKNPMEAI